MDSNSEANRAFQLQKLTNLHRGPKTARGWSVKSLVGRSATCQPTHGGLQTDFANKPQVTSPLRHGKTDLRAFHPQGGRICTANPKRQLKKSLSPWLRGRASRKAPNGSSGGPPTSRGRSRRRSSARQSGPALRFVFEAHRLCVSLNSSLESNKEKEEDRALLSIASSIIREAIGSCFAVHGHSSICSIIYHLLFCGFVFNSFIVCCLLFRCQGLGHVDPAADRGVDHPARDRALVCGSFSFIYLLIFKFIYRLLFSVQV